MGFGRAGVCVSGAVALVLAGCAMDPELALQDALEKSSAQDSASVSVASLYPDAEKVVFVCPYNGAAANTVLGTDAFSGSDDIDEGRNWIAVKKRNGALVRTWVDRTQIDFCSSGSEDAADGVVDGVVEAGPSDSLEFEQRDGTWFLR